jgi:hypothetical protein
MRSRYLIVLTVLGVSLIMVSLALGEGVVDIQRVEELKAVQARHEDGVMGIPGVVGIGIGLTEDGKDLAFIVYVEKLTAAVKAQVPDRIEGVPVRMIESGIFKAY